MKSKRLQAILGFLDIHDSLIDVGCDHAYLSIEMSLLGCQKVLATDISSNVMQRALKSIREKGLENKIETRVCDGLDGIDLDLYNTIVISGMGTSSIEHILTGKKLTKIKKIVLQSNNDLKELREFMEKIGFFLEEEKVILEKNHYYTIMKYTHNLIKSLQEVEYVYGLYNKENIEYYKYLAKKLDNIYKSIPLENKNAREDIKKRRELLNLYLEKEPGSI